MQIRKSYSVNCKHCCGWKMFTVSMPSQSDFNIYMMSVYNWTMWGIENDCCPTCEPRIRRENEHE